MSLYTYDFTPFIVLNSERIIDSIPFKKDSEFFLFHSCKSASEDVLMKLLQLQHKHLEETLEYCYELNQITGLPDTTSITLPMRITPRYELLDVNSDLQVLLKWFHELVQAVEYLHSLNIIHSNLHPYACFIQNNSLVLGELQDVIVDNKYDVEQLRSRTLAPEVKHEDLYPKVSKKLDIFMLGIVLSEWLDSYLCTLPQLPRNYLPSKLESHLELLTDFMQIDCLESADLFPPIFKMISDLLIILLNPDYESRYDASQVLNHNLILIIKRPAFIQSTFFGGLKRGEWTERNIKKQYEKRLRPPTSPNSALWFK